MTDYRYIFGSLISEQVIEEVPLYGVIMNMEINRGGDFQGTFQLDQTGKRNDDLIAACIPGQTWVACERNGACVWHGYIWSRTYSAQSKSVQLFAQTFDHYPKKRINHQDLSYSADPKNIFIDLWSRMQSVSGGNMNINLPGLFATTNTVDLEVLATDFKYYDNLMSSLSDGALGFDWYIATTKDGIHYRKDLIIGSPNLGVGINDGMNVFEYPGNITQYYLTEPMADAGTDIYVVGAGEGSDMIVGSAFDTVPVSTGISPRWEVVVNRKDVNSQVLADSLAQQELNARRAPMPVIKIYVKGNLTPEFGSYGLGDTCHIRIKDPRWPGVGFDSYKRLLKWELTPQSSSGVEEAQLIFEGDPDV